MIKNPQDPVAWSSIVFEKHQDLRALTPSEYDELQSFNGKLHEGYIWGLSKLECSPALARLVKKIDILKREITGSSELSDFGYSNAIMSTSWNDSIQLQPVTNV